MNGRRTGSGHNEATHGHLRGGPVSSRARRLVGLRISGPDGPDVDVFYVVDAKRADAALVDALRRAAGEEHRLGGRLTAHRDVRRIEQSPLDELTLADPGTPSRSHA